MLEYLGGPNMVARVIGKKWQEGQGQKRRCDNGSRSHNHVSISQGKWSVARGSKRQGNGFCILQKECSPVTLWL